MLAFVVLGLTGTLSVISTLSALLLMELLFEQRR